MNESKTSSAESVINRAAMERLVQLVRTKEGLTSRIWPADLTQALITRAETVARRTLLLSVFKHAILLKDKKGTKS